MTTALARAALATFSIAAIAVAQNPTGSVRGIVLDRDFQVPLSKCDVTLVELNRRVQTSASGNYLIADVPPGTYTLLFTKDRYLRQVRDGVAVSGGSLTDVDVSLPGEFDELDRVVVQKELNLGGSSERALLDIRYQSPALVDSIGSELLSKSGFSDAAGALRLVSGASLRDGQTAVIRGLPDRFVSSQLNGVVLPSADEETRAIQLDQFPSAIIESLRVTKTFLPDQQGDASGGAVNVVLQGVPDEPFFVKMKGQVGFNSQVQRRSDFLSYEGGGVDSFGFDNGRRDIQFDNIGGNWDGAVGVSRDQAPYDYKFSLASGGSFDLGRTGLRAGGLASFFYERDSSFFNDGRDDSLAQFEPGAPLAPQASNQSPAEPGSQLFDVTQGNQQVQWGVLAATGIEDEDDLIDIDLSFLYTRTVDSTATLAQDTRGKEFFFPGFDFNDPNSPGHAPADTQLFPVSRFETLFYNERVTSSLQLDGSHKAPFEGYGIFKAPELEWRVSYSIATSNEPDRRNFGTVLTPGDGTPANPGRQEGRLAGANINLGNLQRVFETTKENSFQYGLDLKFPFEQWSEDIGYFKFGYYQNQVERTFTQDTFSNPDLNDGIPAPTINGGLDDFLSEAFPFLNSPIVEGQTDVDTDGRLEVEAVYAMAEIPLMSNLRVVGGVRYETTYIRTTNTGDEFALTFDPETSGIGTFQGATFIDEFSSNNTLPAVSLIYDPVPGLTLRAAWAETVARQTFRELSLAFQQEFLGGPIFIGNPELELATVQNYDLRLDYRPYEGSLISASWFYKDIENAIENVQSIATFGDFTTPVNFPSASINGVEVETRQDLGYFAPALAGLQIGANATFLDTRATPNDELLAQFALNGFPAPDRPVTQAPSFLYNIFATWDFAPTGTSATVFYTQTGDTLLAGGGFNTDGSFVPDVYQEEFENLNFTLSQRLGRHLNFQFKARNLTNPLVQTEYRGQGFPDTTATAFRSGVEYSFSLGGEFRF